MNKLPAAGLLTAVCLSLLMSLSTCRKPAAEASFYFWRTKAVLSPGEAAALKRHGVNTLYVRFFDVDLPEEAGLPQPIGVADSVEHLPSHLTVIPVVFITNRTFLRLQHDTEAISLAKNILKKINGMRNSYPELQIDCDWSEKSKDRYFLLLRTLKKQLPPASILSATIRLHQVKYPIRTGIPPVDRGMLMFYNTGKIRDPKAPNSIFDEATSSSYTPYLKSYALPLDAALPVFRWYIHYRNGSIRGLVTKKQLPEIKDTSYFYTSGEGYYTVKQATLMNGVSYETGDVLKYESLDDKSLLWAAEMLRKNLREEQRRIALYDLDDINIQYYESKTIQSAYSFFR